MIALQAKLPLHAAISPENRMMRCCLCNSGDEEKREIESVARAADSLLTVKRCSSGLWRVMLEGEQNNLRGTVTWPSSTFASNFL